VEAQRKAKVEELVRRAEQADNRPLPESLDIPLELQRREQRLGVIAAAKEAIDCHARERFVVEQAEYERNLVAPEARRERTGKTPGGMPPAAHEPGPRAKDQVNLTDPESRIMPIVDSDGWRAAMVGTLSSNDHDGERQHALDLEAAAPWDKTPQLHPAHGAREPGGLYAASPRFTAPNRSPSARRRTVHSATPTPGG
jgi:hypothetical protein